MATAGTEVRPDADKLPALLEPIVASKISAASGGHIANWRPADRGLSTETFLFDVVDGDGTMLRRLVFRRPPAVALYPDFDLLRQVLVMNRLRHTGVPVPTVCWLDRLGRDLGSPYYVMDQVPNIGGLSDFPSYHSAGLYFDATPEQRAKMWWGCVSAIADVHRLDWRALRLDALLMPRHGAHPLEQVVNYYRQTLRWAMDASPRTELVAAADWLADNLYQPEHLVLCWGDSRLSNILYGQGFEVTAVVDWEIAYIGDHEADLAWFLFIDWAFSEHQQIPGLPGTPSRESTIARYEELTGLPVRNLVYNEVLAAVALACPVLRLQAKLLSDGLITEDFDLVGFCAARIRQLLS
jgi:aminoglycoside phosphotransferase (APT) family kinase protein